MEHQHSRTNKACRMKARPLVMVEMLATLTSVNLRTVKQKQRTKCWFLTVFIIERHFLRSSIAFSIKALPVTLSLIVPMPFM